MTTISCYWNHFLTWSLKVSKSFCKSSKLKETCQSWCCMLKSDGDKAGSIKMKRAIFIGLLVCKVYKQLPPWLRDKHEMGNINKPVRKDMIKSVFNSLTLEKCYTCTFSALGFTKFHNKSCGLMSHHALALLCGGVREGGGGPGRGRNPRLSLFVYSADFWDFLLWTFPVFKLIVNFKIDF